MNRTILKRLLLLGVMLPLWAMAGQEFGPRFPGEPQRVSLVQLICNPEKYDGKLISVVGFLRLEFEEDMLYLNEEDQKHGISQNAVWVQRTPEIERSQSLLSGKYVGIVGTFRSEPKVYGSNGTIDPVRKVALWSDPKEPRMLIRRATRPKPQ